MSLFKGCAFRSYHLHEEQSMNDQIKRRVFLTTLIGGLAVAPLAIRHFTRKTHPLASNDFEQQLKKYRSLLDVPVQPVEGELSASFTLNPPLGRQWKYVFFSPSFFPDRFSQATADEPDTFHVQEGRLFVDQTPKGQMIIAGCDDNYKIYQPTSTSDLPKNPLTLLVQNGRLFAAKPKGTAQKDTHSLHFSDLLSLQSFPTQKFSVGTRWTGKVGRVRPFRGFETEYEIAGFSEVGGCKAVNVRFSSRIPNLLQLPGTTDQKPGKDAVVKNVHHGNAWFDLETGLLVRQETEMTTVTTGVPELGTKEFVVNTKFVAQLFNV